MILASASPHRRKLLQATGLIFDVEPAPIDEAAIKGALLATGGDANSIAGMAAAKAHAVSSRHRDAMVIGADQVLDCEGRLFDKPGSLANARDQLRRLRGRTHQLHSGVALAHNDGIVWQCTDTATLAMRQFSDAFLERYLVEAGDAIWGNVGAYAIEGIGIQLFASVRGDASTIIGLPMLPLLSELRARGMLRT